MRPTEQYKHGGIFPGVLTFTRLSGRSDLKQDTESTKKDGGKPAIKQSGGCMSTVDKRGQIAGGGFGSIFG